MPKQDSTQPQVAKSGIDFLKALRKNNNRDWFNARKEQYLAQQDNMILVAEALLQQMNAHDEIETRSGKESLYRIYRDTRFSTDKTPYKDNWGGRFKRATKYRRGGYYYQVGPGNSFIAGGFWAPNTADLKLIRDDIAFDATPLRKILNSRPFIQTFGSLQGEQLKTAPKGYPADHEAIDLLRYKQFLLIKKFTDEQVLSPHFVKEANQAFKNMRPFLNYMSEVLTTDANGLSK